MPSISPARSAIPLQSQDQYRQPRKEVTTSTGMTLPPPVEAKPVEEKQEAQEPGQPGIAEETDPKAVTLSPQLTALARKQQKLQSEIQLQRDKEAAFAAKEADFIPKTAFKAKLHENAVEALKSIDLDYEELTNLILAQTQGDDPVKKLESKIDQMQNEQKENVSKQYEATVAQYRKEIESLVASDEAYITIKEENRQDAVLQHILETFKSDGEVLSVEEASKDIEEFLVEEAMNKTKLTKVKAKFTPPEVKTDEKKLPPPKQGVKTLTESVDATPRRAYGQFQHLSMKERIAQAVARAQK